MSNMWKSIKNVFYPAEKTHPKFIVPEISLPFQREKPLEETLFVHIHIPKTGGSTFNSIISNNFGSSHEPIVGRYLDFAEKFGNQMIINYIQRHTTIKCLSSHNFTAILPYKNEFKNIVGIAFIRNPIDTFFSYYFHLRFVGGNFVENKMSLDEFINYKINFSLKSSIKFNGFLLRLAGIESEESFNYIKGLVDKKNLYLFDTYDMGKALKVLKNDFPGYFENENYEIENVSKKDQQVTKEHKMAIKPFVSDYDWRLLDIVHNK